jgi:hypothetical protein
MGSFVVGSSLQVPPLRVRVVIDGRMRSDIYCTGIALGHGTGGSTASFIAPARDWDGGKAEFRGAFVQVFVRYEGGTETQAFNGYVSSSSGSVDGRVVELQARSLIAMADSVYLGQPNIDTNDGVIRYPATALRNGVRVATGWNVRGILRDIFGASSGPDWRGGGGSLPSGWRSRLKLGSMAALASSYNDINLGDIVFRQATLADALDQLLGLVGTVSFRERFSGVATYLDFFELGDPGAPVRRVRVARPGEPAQGSNVLAISHDEATDDVRNRIIGLGDRRKLVISLTTDHPTAPLARDWDASLEAAVLANPESAKRGSGGGAEVRTEFDEAKARVFRRFRLPQALRGLEIDADNAVELSDGSKLAVQVFKFGRDLIYNPVSQSWSSQPSAVPVLLEGAELDLANGAFTLKEPAINLVSTALGQDNRPVDVWAPATVGITLTVLGPRLLYDTGPSTTTLSLDGIAADGLSEFFVNESFGYRAIGGAIGSHSFGATMLVGNAWLVYTDPVVLQDDGAALREFVEAALREKRDIRATYSVTTPYWAAGPMIGERIEVIGQDDFSYGTHQVLSLSYNLGDDHSTTFSTDSQVPLTASNVLGGGS